MAICAYCGDEFDVSSVRRSIGRSYGAGAYDDYYPDGDVCLSCATGPISADYHEGEDILGLSGRWDD